MESIKQRWAVYQYGNTKGIIPRQGELVVVKESPYFDNLAVFIVGDGSATIDELAKKILNAPILDDSHDAYIPRRGEVLGFTKTIGDDGVEITGLCIGDGEKTYLQLKNEMAPPGELLEKIDEERRAREAGDLALEVEVANVKSIAEGASVALTFDNYQQLEQWMDGGYSPPDFPTPDELRNGWQALFRDDSQAMWYDAYSEPKQWRNAVSTVNLSGYRTAESQDAIDATKANIASPQFTGVPTAPSANVDTAPDGQIATIKNIKEIWAVIEQYFPSARVTLDDEERATQSGDDRVTQKP
jgi:hypothetical protein